MEMKFCFQWESWEISPYIRGTHLNFVSQTHIIQNPAISAFYASSELETFYLPAFLGWTHTKIVLPFPILPNTFMIIFVFNNIWVCDYININKYFK